jgi:hypothetical protein
MDRSLSIIVAIASSALSVALLLLRYSGVEAASCVDVYGPRPIATAGLIRIDGHNC